MLCYENCVEFSCFENDLDAFIPEIWAKSALELLYENMVVAHLVNRQFENEVADYGDLVHAQRPADSKLRRRTDSTTASTLVQDAEASDIQVPLDQWFNQTFIIRPGEMSKSYVDLVSKYLAPRMKMIARGIDRILLGRVHEFLGTPATRAGVLAAMDEDNAYETMVEADKILNDKNAPTDGRSLILSSDAKSKMLLCDKFVKASERGDGGSALATAKLGHILGFDTYMAQNTNHCHTGADISADATETTYAAEYAGTIALASNTVQEGEYVNIAGNDQPTWATDQQTDTITLNEALKYAVENAAVVTIYKACDVDASLQTGTTYAAGYAERITLDGYTANKGPQVGQLLSFGKTAETRHTYTVIEVEAINTTSCYVLLDRPLEKAVADGDDLAFPGPYGSLCPAMCRDALSLVTRPLAAQNGAGMLTAVQDAYGIGVRVAMQDVINQGRVVSIDLLAGVAVLDEDQCVVVLA